MQMKNESIMRNKHEIREKINELKEINRVGYE